MLILTVDACSPSARLDLVATATSQVKDSERVAQALDSPRLNELLARLPAPDAVAHRFAAGGPQPAIVDDHVRAELDAAAGPGRVPMPESLALLDFLRERLPDVPHVACPDSAYTHRWHGLSLDWSLRRAAHLLGRPAGELDLVLAHVDEDWSVCAARKGVCLDSDGSPADPVDTEDEFRSALRHHITKAAEKTGRLDGLVFTGELGWGSPGLAGAVCAGLPFLGLRGDLVTDREVDAMVSPEGSAVPVLAVREREELQLAEIARRAVEGEPEIANPHRVRLD